MRQLFASLLLIFVSYAPITAQISVQLEQADSLAQQSEFNQATAILNEIIQSKPRNFNLAKAYYQLSYILMQRYDFDRAIYYNAQSLDLLNRLHYEFIAGNYMRFGSIELLRGNPRSALDYFLQAQELPHENVSFSAILNAYQASAYAQLGRIDLAEKYYLSAAETLEAEWGELHPDLATIKYDLGNLYLSQRDFPNAQTSYQAAEKIEQALKPKQPNLRLARIYNALGLVAWQYEEAKEEAKKYFNLSFEWSGANRRFAALAKLNLAKLYREMDDLKGASKPLNQALLLLSPEEEEAPEDFIPLIIDKTLYSSALSLQTNLLFEDYFNDQSKENLERVLQQCELAIAVKEYEMIAAKTSSMTASLLVEDEDLYENAMIANLRMYELTDDQKYVAQAFAYAERSKAQGLKNGLQQIATEKLSGLSMEMRAKLKLIREKMAYYETALLNVEYDEYDEKAKYTLLQLHREHQIILGQLERENPDYYQLRYEPVVCSNVENLQKRIDADEILLSYYIGRQDYYIFVLSRDNLLCYTLPQNSLEIEGRRKGWKMVFEETSKKDKNKKKSQPDVGIYSQIADQAKNINLVSAINRCVSSLRKSDKNAYLIFSNKLYKKLIEPVESALKRKKKLIIIPHKELFYLPFETLLTKTAKPKTKYRRLKYLIKKYAISYHLSADLLLADRQRTGEHTTPSFLGLAPVFNPEDSIGYIWNSQDYLLDSLSGSDLVQRSLENNKRQFRPLQHSENEVVAIAAYFAAKKLDGTAFVHQKATEKVFKEQAGNYQFVHIASHSFLNKEKPERSAVAFAQPSLNIPSKEDGILYAAEAFNLKLEKTKLVVLSSCESGTGKLLGNEGVLSLNRAFLYAGAESTISSLWRVSDKHTAKLMTNFYGQLLKERSSGEALRYAKLKMIKRTKTANPRLWSGFVLTGLD